MKKQECEKARALRKNGESIKQIARTLQVSSSSVSKWTKDIKLTKQQRHLLNVRGSGFGRPQAAAAWSKKNRDRRINDQQQGREDARSGSIMHAMGCMLYWGEGAKKHSRNTVRIVNGDLYLLKTFVAFLRQCFDVTEDSLKVRIRYYSNNGLGSSDIKKYWKNNLGLSKSIFKIAKSSDKRSKKKDAGKLPYGICEITLNNTEIAQRIFGAIKEYAGINDDRWID